jgi:hypothetical protein
MPSSIKRPRRVKPPAQPPRLDQKFRHEIAAEQERLIGRVIAAWSALEDTMQEAIWSFLNISMDEGRIVTARLDANFKINILRGLGPRHLEKEKADDLNALLNTIVDLYSDRNFIAHGKWGTLLPDNLPAAASLREKVDATFNPTHVMVETFPKQRMIAILREIIISMNSMIEMIREHETSHGRRHPPHQQA